MAQVRAITSEQARAARGALGWSIRDLAAKANVAINSISRFENGSGTVLLDTIFKLQDAFEAAGMEFPNQHSVSWEKARAETAALPAVEPRSRPEAPQNREGQTGHDG